MGRKPIGKTAMSGSERTIRWRQRKRAEAAAAAGTGNSAGDRDALAVRLAELERSVDERVKREVAAVESGFEARVQREVERRLAATAATASPPQAEPKPSKTAEADYRKRKGDKNKIISLAEIITKLLPHIDALIVEGKKNMATMSPATVARHAILLKRQLDEWRTERS